ncbi:MAG: hypothetical protein KJP21_07280 [Bacteroidia bacterium]|nr:hypothetical protein [Bacteroidia bacterium]
MMNTLLQGALNTILIAIILVGFSPTLFAQNCGEIQSHSMTQNYLGNGQYEVYVSIVHTNATGGGYKGVKMTLSYGTDTLEKNLCQTTTTNEDTLIIGPYTVADTSLPDLKLDWIGWTTACHISTGAPCAGNYFSLLPVHFLSFDVVYNDNETKLSWQTTNEINNQGFYIQQLDENSGTWMDIGFEPSNSGNNTINDYQFTLSQPFETIYRLRQVDYDGEEMYSNEIYVELQTSQNNESIIVFPNPSSNNNLITVSGVQSDAEFILQDASGNILTDNITITKNGDNYMLDCSRLSPNVYWLTDASRYASAPAKLVLF